MENHFGEWFPAHGKTSLKSETITNLRTFSAVVTSWTATSLTSSSEYTFKAELYEIKSFGTCESSDRVKMREHMQSFAYQLLEGSQTGG